MLRFLPILVLFTLLLSCTNQSMVAEQPSEPQPEKTQVSPTVSEPSIVGKWHAIHLHQKEPSGEVCSQRSFLLEIDSAGIVYQIRQETLSRERMGWIDPKEGEMRAFKTEDDLTKYRFRQHSKDQFRLERNLGFPSDKQYNPDPIANPVTYPDGTEKPEPVRCDTEVWKFRRLDNAAKE